MARIGKYCYCIGGANKKNDTTKINKYITTTIIVLVIIMLLVVLVLRYLQHDDKQQSYKNTFQEIRIDFHILNVLNFVIN